MNAICAISTAQEQGALAVIRISGEDALKVAEKVFVPRGTIVSEMKGYTCAYGQVVSAGKVIDDAVLTVFKAPHSYTGENTAEISCHGGVYIAKKVLRLCIESGARPAERGEFTRTAFLNGKIDITQAESIMEIISAQGELSLKSANLIRQGTLFKRIDEVRKKLIKLLGELEAWADYPEEDLPEVETEKMCLTLSESIDTADKLLSNYDNGMLLKSGIPTVIIGKPNVGKSTLLNLLLGYERAIVTDIAGTTRDILEETVRLGDINLKISDTAGLTDTDDIVEKIGVDLAYRKLDESALVMAVFDGSKAPDEKDRHLINLIKSNNSKVIILINKSDQAIDKAYYDLCADLPYVIEISAKYGAGKEKLENAVADLFTGISDGEQIYVNERQKYCLERAATNLKEALNAVKIGFTPDVVTISIEEAANALSELVGENITESVVNEIFSKFCVGK